ncbi:hypothetical protein D3C79_1004260 [compost metagenome]
MPTLDKATCRLIRPGIVVKVEPGIGVRQVAAPEGEERESGGLQLLQTRIAVQGVGHNQRIHTATLHHPHVAVLVGQIVVGNQQ